MTPGTGHHIPSESGGRTDFRFLVVAFCFIQGLVRCLDRGGVSHSGDARRLGDPGGRLRVACDRILDGPEQSLPIDMRRSLPGTDRSRHRRDRDLSLAFGCALAGDHRLAGRGRGRIRPAFTALCVVFGSGVVGMLVFASGRPIESSG